MFAEYPMTVRMRSRATGHTATGVALSKEHWFHVVNELKTKLMDKEGRCAWCGFKHSHAQRKSCEGCGAPR